MNDYRYNPFENVSTAVTITGEKHVIPSVSPYTVRLNEVPLKETPSSISLTIGGIAANEVSSPPAAGEFWPDYSTKADNDDSWNTGTILFNVGDAGKEVVVSYKGTGRLVAIAAILPPKTFSTSGIWICPDGVREILVTICGGGGGGGGTHGGNNPSENGGSGGRGGTSSFSNVLSALGGWGGGGCNYEANGSYGAAGGVGGTAANAATAGGTELGSGLLVLAVDGVGRPGVNPGTGGTGGKSGTVAGSGGGAETHVRKVISVNPGTQYVITIGGGGVGGQGSWGGNNGGPGAPGICIIEYV